MFEIKLNVLQSCSTGCYEFCSNLSINPVSRLRRYLTSYWIWNLRFHLSITLWEKKGNGLKVIKLQILQNFNVLFFRSEATNFYLQKKKQVCLLNFTTYAYNISPVTYQKNWQISSDWIFSIIKSCYFVYFRGCKILG